MVEKKVARKKASPKKAGSTAVAKPAPSEVSHPDALKAREGKLMVSQAVIMEILSLLRKFFHSGPLPSPEDFAKYNKVLPTAAERMMRMTERGQILRFIERFFGQLSALVLVGGFLYVVFHSQNAFIPLAGAALSFGGGVLYFLRNKN